MRFITVRESSWRVGYPTRPRQATATMLKLEFLRRGVSNPVELQEWRRRRESPASERAGWAFEPAY
jgi:hypothetical protein